MNNKAILESILARIDLELAPQNPIRFLTKTSLPEAVDICTETLFLFTRDRGFTKPTEFTILAATIGHAIREANKIKTDSALAVKTGAFMLYSYELWDIISVTLEDTAKNKKQYQVEVTNNDLLCKMFEKIKRSQTDRTPNEDQYPDWESFQNEQKTMIKSFAPELRKIKKETHPILFETLNRAQRQGWRINKEVYEIQKWCLKYKAPAFDSIWGQHNPEAKKSKLREADTILIMAKKVLDKTFYHFYYYDFRGRKYNATAYLNEQGSDNAKGLLLRAESKVIGKSGYFWLCVAIANNWAKLDVATGLKTDKMPLQGRYDWVQDNLEIILSYADNPKANQGWMFADKPWQFIANVLELSKAHKLRNPYTYSSSIDCFIDGTTNGSQHLAALAKDEVTAPLVNLVPTDLPGDLYLTVAETVWKHVEKDYNDVKSKELEEYVDKIIELRETMAVTAKTALKPLSEELGELLAHKESLEKSCSVFWNRIKKEDRRKVVKRGVMTLPYGGTKYGLGTQVIEDAKKHGIEILKSMERKWGVYMGRLIYEGCGESLKRPMQLLRVFEAAGAAAGKKKERLNWVIKATNFPVYQHYFTGKVKKVRVQYGPPEGPRLSGGYFRNTLDLSVCFIEDKQENPRKQKLGASPNAIHSLDAAHLMLATVMADFNITTVHDSYGALLGDMDELYRIVRESFVALYATNPLESLLNDMEASYDDIGTLDLKEILNSEYAFS